MEVIRKVTAYVTRISEAGVPELLVFKPQDVGVQVPAGTVEEGESYEFAADREVAEETGLTSFERVRFLASIEVPLTDSSRAPVRDSMLYQEPARETPLDFEVPRAHWLEVVERQGDSAKVRLSGKEGWIPAGILAGRMDRSFFHFRTSETTPDRWEVKDGDHDPWLCYWIPLEPRPDLDHEFEEWERRLHRLVLDSVAEM